MASTVRPFCLCVRTDNLILFLGKPGSASVDLSKAIKLKDMLVQLLSWSVQWVITTLHTITPKHRDLRQITIDLPGSSAVIGASADLGKAIGEEDFGQWLDLDRLLVQLWESHSIRPRVVYVEWNNMINGIRYLLPEITRRGIIHLIESSEL